MLRAGSAAAASEPREGLTSRQPPARQEIAAQVDGRAAEAVVSGQAAQQESTSTARAHTESEGRCDIGPLGGNHVTDDAESFMNGALDRALARAGFTHERDQAQARQTPGQIRVAFS